MEGIQTNGPHHQLLHLVEAAQNAGFSEREIVRIVEAELEADAELAEAAEYPPPLPSPQAVRMSGRATERRARCVCGGLAA